MNGTCCTLDLQKKDLSGVLVNSQPTRMCVVAEHDAKNVYSELQSFNPEHGRGKMLFFDIHREKKKLLLHMFVRLPLYAWTVQQSLVSRLFPKQRRHLHQSPSVDIFILTELHEFVIYKRAKRILWS